LYFVTIEFPGQFLEFGGKFKIVKEKAERVEMKLWGYSRLIVELRWPFLSFPHYSNDKKLRRKKKKKWEGRRRRRGRGGKKETNASAVAAAVRHRLSPLIARGTCESRRDGADWMAPDQKKEKEKKVKTGIRRLLGEKKKKGQEELLGREAAAADGPAVVVGAFDRSGRLHQTSFMRPSSSHTYTHTRGSTHTDRGRHTMTALLFSSLLSSQCARTEINKRPKKTRGV
jgi:hypothetical protein